MSIFSLIQYLLAKLQQWLSRAEAGLARHDEKRKRRGHITTTTIRSSKWLVLAAACWALCTTSFFYSSTVLLIPFTLQTQTGIPLDAVQLWTGALVGGYSAVLTLGGPLAGHWADVSRSKKRPMYLAHGLLLAALISTWKGTHVAVWMLGRLCHGAAGSIFWSAGQAMLADAFGPENIGSAVGYVDVSTSLAYLLAPILDGVLLSSKGADAVYGVSLAFSCVGVVLLIVMSETVQILLQGPTEEEEENVQPMTFAAGNTTIQSGTTTWRTRKPNVHLVLDTGDASLRNRVKLVRHLLSSPRMMAALFGCFVAGNVLISYDAIAPTHMERTFHWGPSQVGVALAAWYGPKLLSIVPGKLADRFGARWLTVAGFLSSIPPLLAASFADQNADRTKTLFVLMTVCLSITISLANAPITAEIMYTIKDEKITNPNLFGSTTASGLGFGFFVFSWSLGATVGSLSCARVVDTAGWSAAMYMLVAWCAAGAIVCFVWTGRREGARSPERREVIRRWHSTGPPRLYLGDFGPRLLSLTPPPRAFHPYMEV